MLIEFVEGQAIDIDTPICSFEEATSRTDIFHDEVTDSGQEGSIEFGQTLAVLDFCYRYGDEVKLPLGRIHKVLGVRRGRGTKAVR